MDIYWYAHLSSLYIKPLPLRRRYVGPLAMTVLAVSVAWAFFYFTFHWIGGI